MLLKVLKKASYLTVITSMRQLSSNNPVTQVCIVGAGPAGFYAAMHLHKKIKNINIDIIEKLPVPFGLIRYGVAPDHPEVKNVINSFTKVAKHPNVNFYGNVTLGRDVSLAQLRQHYNAVILTYGAEEDKLLGIEKEDATNVLAARRFVGWYNGLPGDEDLKVDLSGRAAAVLGQGNVAMDVARILLTPIDILSKTDITQHALDVLAVSKIKTVYLVGRRGPLQAAFTIKELREQIKMQKCTTVWRKEDFAGIEEIVPNLQRPRKRLTELMLKSLKEMPTEGSIPSDAKVFKPIFCRSPIKFAVDDINKLSGIELMCNRLIGEDAIEKTCEATGETEFLQCDVAFRSIGYKSLKLDNDINFDSKRGLIVNEAGRALLKEGGIDKGLYVAGWLRTGPLGVILNTMSNAFQVAASVCEDIEKLQSESKGGFVELNKQLLSKNVRVVNWSGWEKIDAFEVEEGKKLGKPREKICTVEKMLEIAL